MFGNEPVAKERVEWGIANDGGRRKTVFAVVVDVVGKARRNDEVQNI